MPTSNPWLTPYQRSFQDIKAKIISELRSRIPEMTDFSEGNIFVLIASIFSAIAEVIHYYIDNMAREAFLPTARRYSSLFKHAKLVDYHIKAAYPASVDLTLYRNSGKPITSDILISAGTVFTSNDGKQWLVSKDITWNKGDYSIKVPLVQKEKVGDPYKINLGNITSTDAIIYLGDLPTDKSYVEGSMVLYIGGELWTLVDTFAYSSAMDKVYKVELDESIKPYIIFGDGRFGMKPDLNLKVEGQYYLTYGALGNIDSNSFSSVPSFLLDIESDILIQNIYAASGGTDYETFDMLKDHIPLSVKTLGVAITKEDYVAVTKMIPGVDKAYVDYVCGKFVNVYITPDGGGEASQALLDEVEYVLSHKKVITTQISVSSTHGCLIYINADIHGRKSFSKTDITDQVKKALVEAYSYSTSDINRVVRLSDIYALIDNQDMVDYLTIQNMYLLPYPYVISSSGSGGKSKVPALNISAFSQTYYNQDTNNNLPQVDLTIEIAEGGYYILPIDYDDENQPKVPVREYGVNQSLVVTLNGVHQVDFSITIGEPSNGLTYNPGDKYALTLLPMQGDLTPVGFNIPIFRNDTINLTVHEVV